MVLAFGMAVATAQETPKQETPKVESKSMECSFCKDGKKCSHCMEAEKEAKKHCKSSSCKKNGKKAKKSKKACCSEHHAK